MPRKAEDIRREAFQTNAKPPAQMFMWANGLREAIPVNEGSTMAFGFLVAPITTAVSRETRSPENSALRYPLNEPRLQRRKAIRSVQDSKLFFPPLHDETPIHDTELQEKTKQSPDLHDTNQRDLSVHQPLNPESTLDYCKLLYNVTERLCGLGEQLMLQTEALEKRVNSLERTAYYPAQKGYSASHFNNTLSAAGAKQLSAADRHPATPRLPDTTDALIPVLVALISVTLACEPPLLPKTTIASLAAPLRSLHSAIEQLYQWCTKPDSQEETFINEHAIRHHDAYQPWMRWMMDDYSPKKQPKRPPNHIRRREAYSSAVRKQSEQPRISNLLCPCDLTLPRPCPYHRYYTALNAGCYFSPRRKQVERPSCFGVVAGAGKHSKDFGTFLNERNRQPLVHLDESSDVNGGRETVKSQGSVGADIQRLIQFLQETTTTPKLETNLQCVSSEELVQPKSEIPTLWTASELDYTLDTPLNIKLVWIRALKRLVEPAVRFHCLLKLHFPNKPSKSLQLASFTFSSPVAKRQDPDRSEELEAALCQAVWIKYKPEAKFSIHLTKEPSDSKDDADKAQGQLIGSTLLIDINDPQTKTPTLWPLYHQDARQSEAYVGTIALWIDNEDLGCGKSFADADSYLRLTAVDSLMAKTSGILTTTEAATFPTPPVQMEENVSQKSTVSREKMISQEQRHYGENALQKRAQRTLASDEGASLSGRSSTTPQRNIGTSIYSDSYQSSRSPLVRKQSPDIQSPVKTKVQQVEEPVRKRRFPHVESFKGLEATQEVFAKSNVWKDEILGFTSNMSVAKQKTSPVSRDNARKPAANFEPGLKQQGLAKSIVQATVAMKPQKTPEQGKPKQAVLEKKDVKKVETPSGGKTLTRAIDDKRGSMGGSTAKRHEEKREELSHTTKSSLPPSHIAPRLAEKLAPKVVTTTAQKPDLPKPAAPGQLVSAPLPRTKPVTKPPQKSPKSSTPVTSPPKSVVETTESGQRLKEARSFPPRIAKQKGLAGAPLPGTAVILKKLISEKKADVPMEKKDAKKTTFFPAETLIKQKSTLEDTGKKALLRPKSVQLDEPSSKRTTGIPKSSVEKTPSDKRPLATEAPTATKARMGYKAGGVSTPVEGIDAKKNLLLTKLPAAKELSSDKAEQQKPLHRPSTGFPQSDHLTRKGLETTKARESAKLVNVQKDSAIKVLSAIKNESSTAQPIRDKTQEKQFIVEKQKAISTKTHPKINLTAKQPTVEETSKPHDAAKKSVPLPSTHQATKTVVARTKAAQSLPYKAQPIKKSVAPLAKSPMPVASANKTD